MGSGRDAVIPPAAGADTSCPASDPRVCLAVMESFAAAGGPVLHATPAGATAVIQPGGSMRDEEVIKAADEAGLAMVFTGHRHFRH